MSSTTDVLLSKIEDALWVGDQHTASILLHKILLQDFTNHQAWLLLHSMRGGNQTLKDFQHSFAQKFYPQLAHLLTTTVQPIGDSTLALPDPITTEDEPFQTDESLNMTPGPLFKVPEPKVATARIVAPIPEPKKAAPEIPTSTPEPQIVEPEPLIAMEALPLEPESQEPKQEVLSPQMFPEEEAAPSVIRRNMCFSCGLPLIGHEKFCGHCGTELLQQIDVHAEDTQPFYPTRVADVVQPAPSTAQPNATVSQHPGGNGSIQIYRMNSRAGGAVEIKLWIDGIQEDDIYIGQEWLYILPEGQHTLIAKWGPYASEPVIIDIKPKMNVNMVCQTIGNSIPNIRPTLMIVPFDEVLKLKKKHHIIPEGLQTFLLILVLILAIIGIGVVAYILNEFGLLDLVF